MNAYFASVEQAANPLLRGRPIAVGGGTGGKRSVVAACSYEAKARGIKNAMPAWEALRICPDLVIVAGDMNKYIYTSAQIMAQLRTYTPQVEVFSIDEAFLDLTETAGRCGGPVAIAKRVKQWIREKFRLTCSIGIGPNKLLAKLAGELKKPDGLNELWPPDIPGKIEQIKVSELCGVGRKLEEYLAQMGIRTFGDLHRAPRAKLVKRFGAVWGDHLWQMGQGKDDAPVRPSAYEEAAKSMGHSYTLPGFTTDQAEVKGYLLRLAEQVGRRLRKENCKGNVVHVSLGFGNYQFWGKQRKVEDYLDDGYEIYRVAERLTLDAQRFALRNRPTPNAVRFVGVTVSGLIHDLDQISLLPQKEDNKKVLRAVDAINDRYGEFTVERAAIMATVIEHKSGYVPSRSFRGH
ncbi:MAG: DNA polymerase IV [Candidatus Margulisbacteria bacterium]|nr:DNA polymerase IV [Candidatus Margulisiibacteriota bacterium]